MCENIPTLGFQRYTPASAPNERTKRPNLVRASLSAAAQSAHAPFGRQAACLSLLAEALLGSWTAVAATPAAAAAAQARSLSLLLTMLGVKLRRSTDAVDAGRTPALHAMAELAYRVLRKLGKTKEAFVPYAGDVS